jgi:hypothetical protein
MSAKQRCVHRSKTCCQSLKHFDNVISTCYENYFRGVWTSFGHLWYRYSRTVGQLSHGGDCKAFEVMTSTSPIGTLGSVASLLAATFCQGSPYRNHKLWNIVSTERYMLHVQVLLECCYNKWKISFLTAPHCQFRGVGQGMKYTYLYLWYPLFQAQRDRCDQRSHPT